MKLSKNEERLIKAHNAVKGFFSTLDIFAAFYSIVGTASASAMFFLVCGTDIIVWRMGLAIFTIVSIIVGFCVMDAHIDKKAKTTFMIALCCALVAIAAYYVGWGIVEVSTWF